MKHPIMIALLGAACLLLSSQAQATPIITPHLGATMQLYSASVYNPRISGGYNYATNLYNTGLFGVWQASSSTPEFTRNPYNEAGETSEHRMVGPFLDLENDPYLMAAGGAAPPINVFTRYNFDGTDPVRVYLPADRAVSTFAWTATPNRMVYNLYKPSANRGELLLADVTPDPFAVTPVTTGPWDGSLSMIGVGGIGPGAITTSSPYIRAVTMGSTYTNYAYYGEGGGGEGGLPGVGFKFWALNIDTGDETLLGVFGTPRALGPGYENIVWTVVERDGYLYVQTTNGDADGNVIKVYEMISATTLGAVVAAYTWDELGAITGEPLYYLGFDVSPDGSRMLISGTQTKAFELTPLKGDANRDGVVDDEDASIVGAHWLMASDASWADGDFNYDGAVNDKDAAILAAHWGQSDAAGSVPEPSTLAMLVGAAVMAWLVRRSR